MNTITRLNAESALQSSLTLLNGLHRTRPPGGLKLASSGRRGSHGNFRPSLDHELPSPTRTDAYTHLVRPAFHTTIARWSGRGW